MYTYQYCMTVSQIMYNFKVSPKYPSLEVEVNDIATVVHCVWCLVERWVRFKPKCANNYYNPTPKYNLTY